MFGSDSKSLGQAGFQSRHESINFCLGAFLGDSDQQAIAAVGVPAAYDYGPERISWLGHLMTDWIGDDGFLNRLNVQVRRHNIIGDLTTCGGTVTRKWVDDDGHFVEVAVVATNQRGEQTAVGTAVATLPCKGE